MPRVTAADVRVIITTALSNGAIDSYITIANPMVTNTVTCGLSAAILKEIERWLTAHLISITHERRTTEEKLGEATVKYESGDKAQSYWDMVLQLDTCGGFAATGKKAVKVTAITSFE